MVLTRDRQTFVQNQKDKDSIYQFKQGDCRKSLQKAPKSSEVNGDIFEEI